MINKWQFCAVKLAESVNYAGSAFSEILENYASNDKLCLKLCKHNLSKPNLSWTANKEMFMQMHWGKKLLFTY